MKFILGRGKIALASVVVTLGFGIAAQSASAWPGPTGLQVVKHADASEPQSCFLDLRFNEYLTQIPFADGYDGVLRYQIEFLANYDADTFPVYPFQTQVQDWYYPAASGGTTLPTGSQRRLSMINGKLQTNQPNGLAPFGTLNTWASWHIEKFRVRAKLHAEPGGSGTNGATTDWSTQLVVNSCPS